MSDSSDHYELDLLAPELLRDPYRTYARLRANRGVHYRSPNGVCSVVSRYADVRLTLLDARFRSTRSPITEDVEPFERSATSKARGLIGDLRHQDSFDVVQDFVEPLAPDALTASAIGNAILALLTHHDQLKWLHHGARLPDATVDELLRYDSPVQRTSRIALVDVELPEGDTIAAGDRVTVLIGAANRDYEQFVEPDQLKLDRRNASQHLTFDAQGCDPRVGPRVRLIVTMALTELFCGLPNLCLSSDPPKYASSFALRRLESLYVLNRAGHRLLH